MKPIEDFIPREIDNPGLKKLLNSFSNTIDECVNFGSNVIQWDLDQARGGDEQMPPVLMLRHFLEIIDAISILIRNSSIDPSKILLRGALEVFFNLEYMLKSNSDQRSMSFLVWHFSKNLKTYKKLDPNSQTGKELKRKIEKDKSIPDFQLPQIPNLNRAISNLEILLGKPQYSQASLELERLKSQNEKNPNWYRFFNGPKNVEQLANSLDYTALYEILYRTWSSPTHGTDIIQGKLIPTSNNSADIVQIRFFKDAQSVAGNCLTIFLLTIPSYIKYRIPDKINEYHKWYNNIRNTYMKISGPDRLLDVK